jgi:ribonuclease VapC
VTGVVVDASAVVSRLLREPGSNLVEDALAHAAERVMAAPTAVELGLVLTSRRPDLVGGSFRILRDLGVEVVAFTAEHAERAVDAWRRFGNGRHAAGLNFGDCCTYAVAEERGLPILCVGEDFRRTGWPVVGC